MRRTARDSITKRGKMAALPYQVLMEVNLRLLDGDSQKATLDWLNSHAEVRSILQQRFGGQPLNHENLSSWFRRDYQQFLKTVRELAAHGPDAFHPSRFKAKLGKIARLPHDIRTQVNERLWKGELYATILEWLNRHPAVVDRMRTYFGGAPVTMQNLSEWRDFGYREWLAFREHRAASIEPLAVEAQEGAPPVRESAAMERAAAAAARRLAQPTSDGETTDVQGSKVEKVILSEMRRVIQGAIDQECQCDAHGAAMPRNCPACRVWQRLYSTEAV